MKEKLQSIQEEAVRLIQAADAPEKLNDVKVRFLGKKGELTMPMVRLILTEEKPKERKRKEI